MINMKEVFETNAMVEKGESGRKDNHYGHQPSGLRRWRCRYCLQKIAEKVKRYAGNLAGTAEGISREFGIPIVNKRVSITPIALVGASCCKSPEDYLKLALTLDRTASGNRRQFSGRLFRHRFQRDDNERQDNDRINPLKSWLRHR